MPSYKAEEILTWPATVNVPKAGGTVDLGTNASYDAVKRGDFPFRVLKIGRKLRVPTADIIAVLGIAQNPQESA